MLVKNLPTELALYETWAFTERLCESISYISKLRINSQVHSTSDVVEGKKSLILLGRSHCSLRCNLGNSEGLAGDLRHVVGSTTLTVGRSGTRSC